MSQELAFDASLDRARIPTSNVETELKCLLNIWPESELRESQTGEVDTSICLVFDCSASMLGEKLETAIESAKMIVDTVHETQRISLIAFQSSIHVLVDDRLATADEKDAIKQQIEQIRNLAGGSTNMADGLKEGLRAIRRSQAEAKVMILLSDGAADFPDKAEDAARSATDEGVQLFAVGIGADYEADHLLKMVTPSNGTVFGDADVDAIRMMFSTLIGRIENFVATNVSLSVTFPAGVQAGLSYKTSPEQAFIGNMIPDNDHTVHFNVGNLERDKAYSFLLMAIAPQQGEGEFELCRAKVTYSVPALEMTDVTQEIPVTVQYTTDARQAEEVNGEVMEVFRRASITQLAERFVRAYKDGEMEQTAKYLGILIRRYDEIGDAAMKNHYETLLHELEDSGEVTQEMLNTSVVASTVVAGGGELPHVLEDTF